MELRHIRYFLAVAETESFTKGADRLAISQPSLSMQIADLEEELGAVLFDRVGRRTSLTEAGAAFREYAERIMREAELATQAVREVAGAHHGRLILGTVSTVNTYLIPALVCRFTEAFPGMQLQVQAGPSAVIETALESKQADIGICLLPLNSARLHAESLFVETLVLVAPAAMQIPDRIRMRDLGKIPLVLLPSDYCLRKMIEAECQRAGVRPKVSVEMTSPEGILEAVKHGAGMTILPELYVRKPRREGLRIIPLYDPVPRHSIGLARLPQRHVGKAAEALMEMCRTTLNGLRPGRQVRAS